MLPLQLNKCLLLAESFLARHYQDDQIEENGMQWYVEEMGGTKNICRILIGKPEGYVRLEN
jgi:hypothetical protein